jgi:hypothetical protein
MSSLIVSKGIKLNVISGNRLAKNSCTFTGYLRDKRNIWVISDRDSTSPSN